MPAEREIPWCAQHDCMFHDCFEIHYPPETDIRPQSADELREMIAQTHVQLQAEHDFETCEICNKPKEEECSSPSS